MRTIKQTNKLFTNLRRGALGLMAGSTAMSAMPHLPEAKAADPPNIIFILADDLGWTDINCKHGGDITDPCRSILNADNPGGEHDSNFYFTPNIAALREKGMRFTNAYAAYHVCGPTRVSVMTGKYPARVNGGSSIGQPTPNTETISPYGWPNLLLEEVTIAEALKSKPTEPKSNYVSCFIGKWHLSGEYMEHEWRNYDFSFPSRHAYWPNVPENGFDFAIYNNDVGNIDGFYWEQGYSWQVWELGYWYFYYVEGPNHYNWGTNNAHGLTGAYDDDTLWGDPCENDQCEYLTDSFTIKAINFLDKWKAEYKNDGRPFFLDLSHCAVHGPRIVHKGSEKKMADPCYIEYFEGCNYSDSRHSDPIYAAMLYSLDESIGRIREHLKDELGNEVANNTVIVLASDNGGWEEDWVPPIDKYTDNAPLREGKTWIYEGGTRVPLIVYWPDPCDPCNPITPANSTCNVPVFSADFWPTFVEMANLTPDDVEQEYEGFDRSEIDGESIVPLLDPDSTETFSRQNNPADPCDDDAMFWHFPVNNERNGTSVIKNGFKLIKKYGDPCWSDPCVLDSSTNQLGYDCDGSFELYRIEGGKIGGAIELDGSDDYMEIPEYKGIGGTNARTVSAWIKTQGKDPCDPCDVTDPMTIISWGSDPCDSEKWVVRINEEGKLEVDTEGSGNQVAGTTDRTDDDWHHVAITFDNSASPKVLLYVDGNSEGSGGSPTVNTGDDEDVKIGRWLTSEDFDGLIDDVRIYSVALTQTEITRLAKRVDWPHGSLVKHWTLDGPVIIDSSANNNRSGVVGGGDPCIVNDPCDPCDVKVGSAALELDGNDYIEIPAYKGITGTNPRTCAAWIKKADTNDSLIIRWGEQETGKEWRVSVYESKLIVAVAGGNIKGSTNVDDGNWYHVAVTWEKDPCDPDPCDIKHATLYVDGSEESISDSDSQTINTGNEEDVTIGYWNATYNRYFNGLIDDVRIYNAALSEDNIKYLVNANDPCGQDPGTDNLQGHWSMDLTYEGDVKSNWSASNLDEDESEDLWTNDPCDEYYDKSQELKDLIEDKWLPDIGARMISPKVRRGSEFFATIQLAIDKENPDGDTIIVWPGIHKEDNNIDLSEKSVTLRSLDPCDPEIVATTILYGKDDGTVVTFDDTSNCILDGFTIMGGNDPCGGGIDGGGDPCSTISRCIIRDNTATNKGGGIYDFDGTIENCMIINNTAANGGGLASCDGTIKNCIIADNIASTSGGGLYESNSDSCITNCTIAGNIATDPCNNGSVGGLYCFNGKVTNCIIWGNADDSYPDGDNQNTQISDPCDPCCPAPTVTYSCIQAWIEGGIGNTANDPCFVNSRSSFDKTTGKITATKDNYFYKMIEVADPCLYSDDPYSPTIIEINNDGVLRRIIPDPCGADPCNIYISFDPPISPAVDPCTIIYIWPEGTTNVREDYHLTSVSPCINEGDPEGDYSGQTDIDGDERVLGGRVDMGADEATRVHNTTKDKWYATINDAIDDASGGDEIVVYSGTFNESVDFDGKAITLRSTHPSDWDVVEATIIDGNDLDSVVRFNGTETSACKLSGFTITNGYGPGNEDGGGIDGSLSGSYTQATVANCIIRDNIAQRHGGGIRQVNGLIDRCIITGNSTVNRHAGGIEGCHGTIRNCLIYENTATLCGGGLAYCNGDIVNCTIADNTANDTGGGLVWCGGTITNCIIWGNDPNQIFNCSATITYSCIQNWAGGGTGNISTDPEFVDPCDPCEPDYHLSLNSPCINEGDPCYTPDPCETDIDGDERVLGGRVDMGADEAARVHNITEDKWYWYINEAIDDASGGDEIVAYEDTYYENVDFDGKAITVRSTDPCDPCVVAATIIDAGGSGYPVKFNSGEGSGSVLKGFTITGGSYGIYISSTSPVISNCIIEENGSSGIYSYRSAKPTIRDSIIRDNSGHGIYAYLSTTSGTASPKIENNEIYENSGYGIYIHVSSDGTGKASPTIENNKIYGNSSYGIYGYNGSAATSRLKTKVKNNWIYENGSYGVREQRGQGQVLNSTIYGHTSKGIYQTSIGSLTVTNCIVWNNNDDLYGCTATYSCIQDIDPGPGNIVGDPNDPLFVKPNEGDYCLGYGSPCIDAANGNVDPPTDIFGQARVDDPNTPNTGVGDPNYVDMGAHEYNPN